MKYSILAITFLSVIISCKKDVRPDAASLFDSEGGAAKRHAGLTIRFEPEHKSTNTLGTVTLNDTLYIVATEFTDAVAFKQEGVNINGEPEVLNYREMMVHLINRSNDTITVRKAFFKNQLPDYDSMILQSVHLNRQLKTGVVPLLIYFCVPESDSCIYFDLGVNRLGYITTSQIDEVNFSGYEE